MNENKPLRLLMVGAFATDYPRQQIIRAGLEQVAVTVILAQTPRGLNTLRTIPHIVSHWRAIRDCDVVFVPAFNQLIAPLIVIIARLFGKPILIDYMVGLTDSLADERDQGGNFKRGIWRRIDHFNSARMRTLTDTEAHRLLFERRLGVKSGNMRILPVGVYDPWFYAQPPPPQGQIQLVQFFGTYIPFHGVDVIIDAIAYFKDDPLVHFELIGTGKTYSDCRKQAETLGLRDKISFVERIAPEQLPARVAEAAICLGVFGARDKTDYVVPNKVFQSMTVGRPVITAEASALHEFFTPGEHLITVPPGDAEALAHAIRALLDSPVNRIRLGDAAAARIREAFLAEHIGAQLKIILMEFI